MEETSKETKRLLYVGSLIKRKGVDLLIEALKYVDSDYELRIVGGGSEEEVNNIKCLAQKEGILDKIVFCGFKQDRELVREYEKAFLFLLPTREDCFGLVLVEALAMRIPIIASKYADGAYDVIENYKNGIIVDPYNAKDFAKTIENVLKGKIFLSGDNENIINKFKFENTVHGYIDAIDYVMMKGSKE